MTIQDLLLFPFRKYFRAPGLDIPFSTIKMPRVWLTVTLCLGSFFVITSGYIYCFVSGTPMVGYSRDQFGGILQTWISPSLSSQYLTEGIMAAIIFTMGAGSLIAAFYAIHIPEKQQSELDHWIALFGYTCPVWQVFALVLFRMKIPSYFPAIFRQ
jgi:hypothetical protein